MTERECPECGSEETKPLLWGMPEKEPGDDVILAGCSIELEGLDREGNKVFGTPDWGCVNCGRWWVTDKQVRHLERMGQTVSWRVD